MNEPSAEARKERAARKKAAKISGQNRIARNLASRWLGQIVVIVSGFVIPRLIDDSLGAVALGIWDSAWATVSYFRFIGFGLSGGLNRFVALYNAQEAYEDLKRAVSSTFCVQLLVAAITAVTAVLVAMLLPQHFKDITPAEIEQGKWVIIFLGGNLAIRMLFWPTRSILTGYHFWTITSAVTAVGDTVLLIGMFIVLKTGGGLADLGMLVFFNAIGVELIRLMMAKRIYPFPMFLWSSVDWATMRKMAVFGIKNSLTGLPHIVAVQTTSLMLAATAGPAMLAVYARPLALFSHIERLIVLYAFLLTPMAASLQGLKREQDLKAVLLTSLASSFAMTIPPMLLLIGYGDVLIRVWMGADYVVPVLAPILGCAFLFPYAHSVAMRILVGIDSFGRLALWSLVVTVAVLLAGIFIANNVGWSAEIAACVAGASLFAGQGMVIIVGACRRLSVSLWEYLSRALFPPLACNTVLAVLIVLSRLIEDDVTIIEAAGWSGIGGVSVIFLYWKYLLNDTLRERLRSKVWRRRPVPPKSAD